MTTASRQRRVVDWAGLAAYIGTGAAIAFIAAMTFGAIDAPMERSLWTADSGSSDSTQIVSTAQPQGNVLVR